MTSEQNVSEVDSHQGSTMSPGQSDGEANFAGSNIPHGMGQSKSSRRRRRKRKGKGPEGVQGTQPGGEQNAGQPVGSIQGSAAQPQAFQPQGQQPFQGAGQQQNSNGTGAKRWKKKFRDRDRQRGGSDNPGNVASAGSNNGGAGGFRDRDTHQPGNSVGGFKRKGGGGGKQQRGPRSFVGPMDHSYRVANGNFADAPPSTMDAHNGNYQGRSNGGGGRGGYQSDSQPIDYSQGRTIPIPEDAPTKIFFFIEDLFFIAKIQETARKLGVKVGFVKNDKESIAALVGVEEENRPGLIVFDLNNANAKPLTLIPKLKTKLKKSTSIVGFLSHLQGDLKAKAVDAGCDTVMPRAAFSQNLPNLLRRYGMEEEDEPNFNQ
ncbi:response regulator [Granulicella sp. L60]|uniref:response regulator n=1 Tax=Granulicella sp. L60 TaxID=1641866 RepID=UPI00131CB4BD|nr:response regulator [Granulicella sp. L60]